MYTVIIIDNEISFLLSLFGSRERFCLFISLLLSVPFYTSFLLFSVFPFFLHCISLVLGFFSTRHPLKFLFFLTYSASSEEMVYILDQQLIVFYVLTLKLRETIEANFCKPQAKLIAMPFLPSLHKSNPETKPDHKPQLPPPQPLDSPWIISIIEKINQARQDEASSTWDTQSIYRVPKTLRDVDPTAYTPKIVSIGPYHRGCRHLSTMDRHKWRSLHRVLDRTGHDVRLYLDAARSLEVNARSCYEAPISMSSDDFVETLVLDSIFALELFRGVALKGFQGLGYSPNDPVFTVSGIMFSLQHDMIMLENQLPLFVLDRILSLQDDCEPSRSNRVASLAINFFKDLMPTEEFDPTVSSDTLYKAGRSGGALHCLDVFRRSLLPHHTPASCPRPSFRSEQSAQPVEFACPMPFSDACLLPIDDERYQQLIHCVADLRDAGIKFRRRTGVPFWDIEFKDGVLYIPRLFIQDGTKSLFLNLIAFEQCHLECGNHITSYISFMDYLINSKVDVGYLHDKEIIEHWLGSDKEVVDMFNQLCHEVVIDSDDCYLLKISMQVNRYYSNKCNTWRASFNQKYFSNPWAFISLMAAVVLLLLTALQTFYTVYPYFKPK
ncbi:UPF0481 protein At3g47200-like [Dendrobium catenatum]|uniref:UPF0481 protein n=1 Tax=Dendrobium catenatum TaxID=906689 RepID=A0A2I0X9M8_9ASPA|nr:UPF0481 protein At3g47200-like [Dendrobium catenatum]PKU84637.1 UPF0481 protein [Dendrobium catenatum]